MSITYTYFRKKYCEYAYICPYVHVTHMYEYTNGKWEEKRKIPKQNKTWGYVSTEKGVLKSRCKLWKEMLENLSVLNTETKCEKTYYTITYTTNFIMRRSREIPDK